MQKLMRASFVMLASMAAAGSAQSPPGGRYSAHFAFALKARQSVRISRERWRQNLDGDRPRC